MTPIYMEKHIAWMKASITKWARHHVPFPPRRDVYEGSPTNLHYSLTVPIPKKYQVSLSKFTPTPEVVAEYMWTCCNAANRAALRRESEKENSLLQYLRQGPAHIFFAESCNLFLKFVWLGFIWSVLDPALFCCNKWEIANRCYMEELSNLFQSRFCFSMPTAQRPKCFQKVADVKPSMQLRMAIPGAKVEWARKLQWEKWPQTCPCRNLGASFVWIVASQFLNKQAGEVYETDFNDSRGGVSWQDVCRMRYIESLFFECSICIYTYVHIYIYTPAALQQHLVWLSTKMVSMPKSK